MYKERLSIERKAGFEQKVGFQNKKLAAHIKRSFRINPNMSERTMASKYDISKSTVKAKAGF